MSLFFKPHRQQEPSSAVAKPIESFTAVIDAIKDADLFDDEDYEFDEEEDEVSTAKKGSSRSSRSSKKKRRKSSRSKRRRRRVSLFELQLSYSWHNLCIGS